MEIRYLFTQVGGHTEIELQSSIGGIRTIGTFCLQIPHQIRNLKPNELFEIPDDFMRKELGIDEKQDPVKWYFEKSKEAQDDNNASEINALFEKFMDAIAKYCNYDRAGVMERHERETIIP